MDFITKLSGNNKIIMNWINNCYYFPQENSDYLLKLTAEQCGVNTNTVKQVIHERFRVFNVSESKKF